MDGRGLCWRWLVPSTTLDASAGLPRDSLRSDFTLGIHTTRLRLPGRVGTSEIILVPSRPPSGSDRRSLLPPLAPRLLREGGWVHNIAPGTWHPCPLTMMAGDVALWLSFEVFLREERDLRVVFATLARRLSRP